MKTVYLLGDSIRLGYQDTVRSELSDIAHVLAPDENCRDTRNILEHLDRWLEGIEPDAVHVNAGLHDIKRVADPDQCEVPIGEYTTNVRKILDRLSAVSDIVIWASTTPVNETDHHANKEFDRFEVDVVRYNEAAHEVAGQAGALTNPLFDRMVEAGPADYLLKDGVHFTPEGSTLLGRWVGERVREALT